MLLDYVRNTAERIIAEKERAGKIPACCTLTELMKELTEDITECMRQLHRDKVFTASTTVNKIPMLIRKR